MICITGTNTKHRTEFKRMIDEALAGKFDMIITKSISRFARNNTKRNVSNGSGRNKEKGITCWIFREN